MYKLIAGQGFDLILSNHCTAKVRFGAGVGDHAAIAADVPESHLSVADIDDTIANSLADVAVYIDGELARAYKDVMPDHLVYILGQASIAGTEMEFLEISV